MPDEPTAEEMRERADRARAKRAAERAARKAEEAAVEEKKETKKKRQWWNWLIDAALISLTAYLIWARFLRKDAQPNAPSTKASVSASASAVPTIALKIGTELHGGPGPMFSPVETIVAPTTFETVETSDAGWVKVKVPSGRVGWVPVDAIGSAIVAPSAPSASASSVTSASSAP